MTYLIQFGIAFVVFMGIDLIWLGIIAKPIYAHYLSDFLRPTPNWPVAFLFYTLFIIGLIIFAIQPGVAEQSVKKASIMGALFGFFTYMTYELTNWAVIKDWPAGIVPIDILWGIILSTSVSGISTFIYIRYVA